MAIGTTAAILGSAVIGAGASAAAGAANSRAVNRATQAQTEGNAASLALQERVFNTNRETLGPFVQRGNQAGGALNALLGIGGSQPSVSGESASGADWNAYLSANPDVMQSFGTQQRFATPQEYAQHHFANHGRAEGRQLPASLAPQQAAENAFDIFRNSTGYQFRLNEGMNALNSGLASSGILQSGAAMRAATEYGQNFASNEFGNFANLLGNQQAVGLSAAGAQAGVGVNFANAASNINQNNANALSSAAVARANNTNATIGGIGNAFGSAMGGLAYAPRSPNAMVAPNAALLGSVNQTFAQNPGIF